MEFYYQSPEIQIRKWGNGVPGYESAWHFEHGNARRPHVKYHANLLRHKTKGISRERIRNQVFL